jgi:hypothetical protein
MGSKADTTFIAIIPDVRSKLNVALPLRQGQSTLAKKAILPQQEYFYLFIFNGLCQLQRQFIVSFDNDFEKLHFGMGTM